VSPWSCCRAQARSQSSLRWSSRLSPQRARLTRSAAPPPPRQPRQRAPRPRRRRPRQQKRLKPRARPRRHARASRLRRRPRRPRQRVGPRVRGTETLLQHTRIPGRRPRRAAGGLSRRALEGGSSRPVRCAPSPTARQLWQCCCRRELGKRFPIGNLGAGCQGQACRGRVRGGEAKRAPAKIIALQPPSQGSSPGAPRPALLWRTRAGVGVSIRAMLWCTASGRRNLHALLS